MFARAMKTAAVISALLTAAAYAAYAMYGGGLLESLYITFGATAYHVIMRLMVGELFDRALKNNVDYTRPWFRLRPFERRLYEALGVKRWKGRMPTYDPSLFSLKEHSFKEIAMAMCQAELVHEACAALSFAPLLVAGRLGGMAAFLITSILSACIDLAFVIMQRYNRPRIIKLIR